MHVCSFELLNVLTLVLLVAPGIAFIVKFSGVLILMCTHLYTVVLLVVPVNAFMYFAILLLLSVEFCRMLVILVLSCFLELLPDLK